jgi:hypothetical protein
VDDAMAETVRSVIGWWTGEGSLGSPRVRKLEEQILEAGMLHKATPESRGVFLKHTPQRENQDAASLATTLREATKLRAVHPLLSAEKVGKYSKAW